MALTPSGAQKDKFHFTYPTAQWESLSKSGVQAGYGPQWAIVNGSGNSLVYVSYGEPLAPVSATDLILDIRYNGGGYLDIASEVAWMIAGAGPTNGVTFEETEFNSKHPTVDPVTLQTITPVPFHSETQGFSTTAGLPLPALNLKQVFVLTGPGTCSASEAIINGLIGVNVKVVQIGSTTCGKPYGFRTKPSLAAPSPRSASHCPAVPWRTIFPTRWVTRLKDGLRRPWPTGREAGPARCPLRDSVRRSRRSWIPAITCSSRGRRGRRCGCCVPPA